MHLARIMYYSTPLHVGDDAVCNIRDKATSANTLDNITGVLVFDSTWFVQILEGDQTTITNTFSKICRDPRHKDITLMDMSLVGKRQFSSWAMGYLGQCNMDERIVGRYMPRGFDPRVIVHPENLIEMLTLLGPM